MDTLAEVPRHIWSEVRDSFKQNWPFGLCGYYTLDTQIRYPDISALCQFRVFSAFGDFHNGIVAFNTKGTFREIIMLTQTEDTTKLEEAIALSHDIDWRDRVCVVFADVHIYDLVQRLCPRLGLKVLRSVPCSRHYRSKHCKPYELVDTPPNTYVGPVRMDDAQQVDSTWPHRHESSFEFYKVLIKNNLSYGLFSKEDETLLAWIFINEVGFLLHLYCEEQHRRKGYAEFITKYAANDQAKQGRDVYCYTVDGNTNSYKLFGKLGFEISGRGIWTYVAKHD